MFFNICTFKNIILFLKKCLFCYISHFFLTYINRKTVIQKEMMMMKYTKTENVLDEIDWGNGRKFKCNSYWNDNTSFALDIGRDLCVDCKRKWLLQEVDK